MSRWGLTLLLLFAAVAHLEGQVVVGQDRPVEIHVPSTYSADIPMPLVLLLHGYPQDGPAVEALFRFLDLSERFGFLYAFPNGSLNPCGERYWNAFDYCCANFCGAQQVDDSRYLRSVIEETMQRLAVDATRVYVVGFSAGGDMAHRMACDHGDLLAGIASMSGATATTVEDCPAESAVHVLQIHGTGDSYFLGGTFAGFTIPGAAEIARIWGERNGCTGEIEPLAPVDYEPSLEGDETTITRRVKGCKDGGSSELWAVKGGGHFVGGEPLRVEIVNWLLSHPKRPSPIAACTAEPVLGTAPLPVSFNATGSQPPPDGTLDRASWDFGDGGSDAGFSPIHTFRRPGRWLTTLQVITTDGRSAWAQHNISVVGRKEDTSPWLAADIGLPLFPGSATRDTDGALHLVAGGNGIGGSTSRGRDDQVLFLSQTVEGDFRLRARFAEPQGGGLRSQVGLMVRTGLESSSPMLALVLEPNLNASRARLLRRSQPMLAPTALDRVDTSLPRLQGWLALERKGQAFGAWWSADGADWNQIADGTTEGFAGPLLVGCTASGADLGTMTRSYEALQALVRDLEVVPLLPPISFLRGECNGDGTIDISDAVCTLLWPFLGAEHAGCLAALDTNGDAATDLSDAVWLLTYLFLGGPPPAAPFPSCGPLESAADRALGCSAAPAACP